MVWDGKLYASTIVGDSTIFGQTNVTIVGGSGALGSVDDDTSYVLWDDTSSGGYAAVFDAVPAGVSLGKDPVYGFYDFEVHARWRYETTDPSHDFQVDVNNPGIGYDQFNFGTTGTPPDTLWTESGQSALFDAYMTEANILAGQPVEIALGSSSTTAFLRVTAVWLQVWPKTGIPPLRQWPRDDGLRSNPKRGGVAGPVSRQGSIRRGPRGNYT